jgi:hypothetical protein
MLFSSTKEKRGVNKARSRKGAVAFMAVLVVVVMAILFQAYSTHVLSDMKTGQTFDTQSQYNGERMAIGNLVKEAVLQYYERPRVGQDTGSISSILSAYLTAMDNGSTVNYSISYPATETLLTAEFPPATDATNPNIFWPKIPDVSVLNAETKIGGTSSTFILKDVAVPSDILKSRVAQFVGNPDNRILSVFNGTSNVFPITVTRSEGGKSINFRYYVRLYQVPVTDFNLAAYAITDVVTDIPATPPTINAATSAKITNGTISTLALSRMNVNTGINKDGTFPMTAYPYIFRELFSSAASVWEYVFYKNTTSTGRNINFMMDVIPNRYGVYALDDPYMGGVTQDNLGAGGTTTTTPKTDMTGASGFDPDYRDSANNMVNADGYRVDANGKLLYTSKSVAVGGATIDTNGDGIINDTDWDGDGIYDGTDEGDAAAAYAAYGETVVPKLSPPVKVSWTFDLDKVADPTTGDTTFRRIYIHLPDSQAAIDAGQIKDSSITITDLASGAHVGSKPFIICVEGWSSANKLLNHDASRPTNNYKVYLGGGANMLDQQVALFVVGADVVVSGPCQMNGMLLLDDRLAGFSAVDSFTLNGLVAWSGVMSSAQVGMNVGNVTINRLAGTNSFRSVSPRFLLVDVRSETK